MLLDNVALLCAAVRAGGAVSVSLVPPLRFRNPQPGSGGLVCHNRVFPEGLFGFKGPQEIEIVGRGIKFVALLVGDVLATGGEYHNSRTL